MFKKQTERLSNRLCKLIDDVLVPLSASSQQTQCFSSQLETRARNPLHQSAYMGKSCMFLAVFPQTASSSQLSKEAGDPHGSCMGTVKKKNCQCIRKLKGRKT